MKLRYKYRLYPTKDQEELLRKFGGSSRYIWNLFLAKNIEEYKNSGKFLFINQMSSLMTQERQNTSWLKDVSYQVLQQKLRDLHQAFINRFKHKRGFPKFKKKSDYSDHFRFSQSVKVVNKKVYLEKIGWVKQEYHRPLPSAPKTATVILDGKNWYVSFVVDVNEENPIEEIETKVGLDFGVKAFLTTSDGEVFGNPRFLDKSLKKLKRQQRKLSRKKPRSSNRRKQILKVRKIHKDVRNRRLNFLHRISSQITNENDLICIEDLNIRGMIKNRKLSRAISQIGWSMFVNMLQYKCKLKGKILQKVGRFFPSSKTCSGCGYVKSSIPLHIRVYKCDSCGISLDRDHNAACNILMKVIEQNRDVQDRIRVCGESSIGDGSFSSRYDSSKQKSRQLEL